MSAQPEPCIGQNPTCPCQDGAACHYEDTPTTKGWPAPPSDTRLNQRAEEIMLADVDGYAEWLSGHCCRHEPIELLSVSSLGIVSAVHGGAFLVEAADVPTLLALTLYPRADVVASAQWELRNRYLADERLFKLAQEKAAEES